MRCDLADIISCAEYYLIQFVTVVVIVNNSIYGSTATARVRLVYLMNVRQVLGSCQLLDQAG